MTESVIRLSREHTTIQESESVPLLTDPTFCCTCCDECCCCRCFDNFCERYFEQCCESCCNNKFCNTFCNCCDCRSKQCFDWKKTKYKVAGYLLTFGTPVLAFTSVSLAERVVDLDHPWYDRFGLAAAGTAVAFMLTFGAGVVSLVKNRMAKANNEGRREATEAEKARKQRIPLTKDPSEVEDSSDIRGESEKESPV